MAESGVHTIAYAFPKVQIITTAGKIKLYFLNKSPVSKKSFRSKSHLILIEIKKSALSKIEQPNATGNKSIKYRLRKENWRLPQSVQTYVFWANNLVFFS